MKCYFLMIRYSGSGSQVLMHMDMSNGNRAIGADEANKDLLIAMGDQLLTENIIASYQLVQTVGPEVNNLY